MEGAAAGGGAAGIAVTGGGMTGRPGVGALTAREGSGGAAAGKGGSGALGEDAPGEEATDGGVPAAVPEAGDAAGENGLAGVPLEDLPVAGEGAPLEDAVEDVSEDAVAGADVPDRAGALDAAGGAAGL